MSFLKFATVFLVLLSLVSRVNGQESAGVDGQALPEVGLEGSQGIEGLEEDAPEIEEPEEDLPPTEPLSVAGVVQSVVDSEGNEYRVLVVRPMQLTTTPISETYTVEVPYSEMTDQGMVTRTRLETKTRSLNKMVAGERPAVMIPLLKSTPCFRLDGSSRIDASTLEVGQHLLVAGSTFEALQVASEIRKSASQQVVLTGMAPPLPELIVALSDKPKSEQAKSLFETLNEASPYRTKTTFFGDLKLVDPHEKDAKSTSLFPSKRHAEVAWIKARQDFFSNRYDSAEPTLDALIEMESKEPMVHYFRGIIRFNRGDSEGASMDFANGAELESSQRKTSAVSQDLANVQGFARQALEEYRSYYRRSR